MTQTETRERSHFVSSEHRAQRREYRRQGMKTAVNAAKPAKKTSTTTAKVVKKEKVKWMKTQEIEVRYFSNHSYKMGDIGYTLRASSRGHVSLTSRYRHEPNISWELGKMSPSVRPRITLYPTKRSGLNPTTGLIDASQLCKGSVIIGPKRICFEKMGELRAFIKLLEPFAK